MTEQTILVAAVVVLVEVLKRAGVPTKFLPLIAVAVSIGIVLASTKEFNVSLMLEGAILGASAVGVYSGTKNVVKTKNPPGNDQEG